MRDGGKDAAPGNDKRLGFPTVSSVGLLKDLKRMTAAAASKGGSARATEEMIVSKDQQPMVLAARSMPAGDVLVVDDSSTVGNLLKRTISRMGQEVDTACTGKVGGLVLCNCGSGRGTRARALECCGSPFFPRKRAKQGRVDGVLTQSYGTLARFFFSRARASRVSFLFPFLFCFSCLLFSSITLTHLHPLFDLIWP